ncbi:MAG: 3-hydroxyacyl-CoA dehydrogenase [Gammaproteobacteria bacterium]|nr:3-hydroxyacyl-CoA dehydrogenase [Gammaproteobacteria bacterium]
MSAFRYAKDADGIVTITMDMSGAVNAMTGEYRAAMAATSARLSRETDLTGVILTSAKKDFFAGGDLKELLGIESSAVAAFIEMVELGKEQTRTLETLGVPVVAAINGSALGGGYELCLACHYRMAAENPQTLIGLPEVQLGLLPGMGGVVRLVQLLGLTKALPYLLEGKKIPLAPALQAGLIDEVVPAAELLSRAKAYLLANKRNPSASTQPWDTPGRKATHLDEGVDIDSVRVALMKKTRGLLPAPMKILDCAIAAARVDFDAAMRVETRGIADLVITPVAKNMITAFFFQLNQVAKGLNRPAGLPINKVTKIGVLGAGMMGQGIAYVAAKAGIQVRLKSSSLNSAQNGRNRVDKLLRKQLASGHISEEKKQRILALIEPVASDADLAGCDIIIESVPETLALKKQTIAAASPYLREAGILGSNTSSIPIWQLAQVSGKPESVIGIHFFSPVDKMALVEIVRAEATSDATLAKACDFVNQLKKTAIVVKDSPSFFTSRTFNSVLDEAMHLLVEGVAAQQIDAMGKAIGMPLGPLMLFDQVSLVLTQTGQQTWKEAGIQDVFYDQSIMRSVVDRMINEYGRGGRYHGGGFYDYADNRQHTLWPELEMLYGKADVAVPDQDIKDRLLFRPIIETLRCLETGVLSSVAEGNIGSLLGIGAPTHTGGYIQYVNTYGLQRFIDRCEQLQQRYGERFNCPGIVAQQLDAGALFV